MQFSMADIWQHMGGPALAVASVLIIMGLASLTVFVERLITFQRSRAVSRRFGALAASEIERGNFELALQHAEKFPRGHLARVVRAALATYAHAQHTADVTGLTPVERTVRHMERYMQEIGADLRRGMSVLATVGSVAPFVGLLGTVLGIITAFQGIASTGSGGLSGVSAGIAEALIETALGLAVAIPAVLAFNYLAGRVAREEQTLNHACGHLLDTIEDWAERKAQGYAGAGRPISTPAHDGVKSPGWFRRRELARTEGVA
jgi:biopolymer transport protein ExbB